MDGVGGIYQTVTVVGDFDKRTGMPSQARREELSYIGARYLRSDTFSGKDGVQRRLEQMQLLIKDGMYMWKRIVTDQDEDTETPFQIHLELSEIGVRRYELETRVNPSTP